jgi:hypothetical protein
MRPVSQLLNKMKKQRLPILFLTSVITTAILCSLTHRANGEETANPKENLAEASQLSEILGGPGPVLNLFHARRAKLPDAGPDYRRYGWFVDHYHHHHLEPFEPGAKPFSDRRYVAKKIPAELEGARFVQGDINGVDLECSQAGWMVALTPKRMPGSGHQGHELEKAGFQPTSLDPFPLFGTNESAEVQVYWKKLRRGERLRFRKWVVLVVPADSRLVPVGEPTRVRNTDTDSIDLRRRGAVVRTTTPPVIDGSLDDATWQIIPPQHFRNLRSWETWQTLVKNYKVPPRLGALSTVQLAFDGQSLYLALRCDKLLEHRRPWTNDDRVEIFLQPGAGNEVTQLAVSADGSGQGIQGAKFACRDHADHYSVEIAIPFATLQTEPPQSGQRWKANFCRTEKPSDEPTAWSFTDGYDTAENFGTLEFVSDPPVIPQIFGRISNASCERYADRVLVESPAGIFLADRRGAFVVSGQVAGKTQLRIGSVRHETRIVECSTQQPKAKLPEIELTSIPKAQLAQLEAAAAKKAIHLEPDFQYAPVHRDYQACPAIVVLPDGRLMATYTCYGGETEYNAVIVDASSDAGHSWEHELVIKPGFQRASWGNLWVDPLKRTWLIHQLHRKDGIVWYARNDRATVDRQTWSEPSIFCDKLGHKAIFFNKPIVLSDGTWMAPVSAQEGGCNEALAVVSNDQGKSWRIRGSAKTNLPPNCPEPMIVQRRDGSLWMLMRTGAPWIAEFLSTDGGRTWMEQEPNIPHTPSRFHIRRLQSGRLLLVKNGPMQQPSGGRDRMTAFLSDDDGKTWPHSLRLFEGACSYPDADQAPDGRIFVIYDRGRTGPGARILMSSIREEDILAGALVAKDSKLNLVVAITGPNDSP